jgi:hypothetical protein
MTIKVLVDMNLSPEARVYVTGSFKVSIHATAGSLVQISVIPITIIVLDKNL